LAPAVIAPRGTAGEIARVDDKPKGTDANWDQWRGPGRDSIIKGGKPWPKGLTEAQLKKKWRVEMGPGYPGPVCNGELVFSAATLDKAREEVFAFDKKDGKKVWSVSWPGAMTVPFFARENGDWIRSTPALDGDRLYVAGMKDVLVCINIREGREMWRKDFVATYKTPVPDFGFVCSPLVQGDAVYVQAGASLFKLDKMTGEEKWRSMKDSGGMMGSAFSSPIIAPVDGRETLLVQSRTTLAGVDPQNGSVIWKKDIPAFRGMNILTPLVTSKGIFTSSYGGKGWMIEPKGSDPKVIWESKTEAYMSSPVLIDGHIYTHLRNQRFTCIEVETGKVKWTTSQSFGKYWSMVANGKEILALDQKGVLRLIRANPEKFELLSERKVSDQETWAHLAVDGDTLFIRDLQGLSAWSWTEAGPSGS